MGLLRPPDCDVGTPRNDTKKNMLNKCKLPTDCVVAVTYRCNSRCTMCDIWKMKDFSELSPDEFLKLPKSLKDINISGGEPFLRNDLPEIVGIIKKKCPDARIIISSNGFATDLIINQMKNILVIDPHIGVAISIDGINEMHDDMRGIPGGYEKAIETVKELQKLGMKNLRLAFTVTEKNVTHFSKVYNLSRGLGVQFTHTFAQSSEFYFGGKQNVNSPRLDALKKQYDYLIKKELASLSFKRWARAYYTYGMHKFISSREPMLSNAPGRDFFFLDPSGDIYPSVVHNVKMGNIKHAILNLIQDSLFNDGLLNQVQDDKNYSSFEQFWCSKETNEIRNRIDSLRIPVWMICTARTAIKKHPFKAGIWFVKNII